MFRLKTFQDLFKRYRRPGDLVFAVLFLVITLFLVSQIGEQTVWKKGTKLFAQPRFWPSVLLISMSVFVAFHLLGSAVSPRIDGRWQEAVFWLRSLEYVGWFLAYVMLVPIIGYLFATIFFTVALTLRLGYHSVKWLGVSAVSAILIVVVFKSCLQVKVSATKSMNACQRLWCLWPSLETPKSAICSGHPRHGFGWHYGNKTTQCHGAGERAAGFHRPPYRRYLICADHNHHWFVRPTMFSDHKNRLAEDRHGHDIHNLQQG